MILELKSISKTYKTANVPAVDKVDLQISKSKIFGLLGPNGAGKSTLINIISGLLAYDSGTISWQGEVSKSSDFKSKLGLVPQDIALYSKLTAFENLDFLAAQYNIPKKNRHNKINEYLDSLGLYDKRNQQVRFFSGGMKRRVNLIAALLHNPELLILDEPSVGTDVQSKNAIHEFLLRLNQQGVSMIYTSHMMEEAEKICDDVAIIDKGRIIAKGTPKELIDSCDGAKSLEDVFITKTGKEVRNL
jgi:ABC-2 type transport system ATP-binding protein